MSISIWLSPGGGGFIQHPEGYTDITADTLSDSRADAVDWLITTARASSRPVEALVTAGEGDTAERLVLHAHPDGTITTTDAPPVVSSPAPPVPTTANEPVLEDAPTVDPAPVLVPSGPPHTDDTQAAAVSTEAIALPPRPHTPPPAQPRTPPVAPVTTVPQSRREAREKSFLKTQDTALPASQGWRGLAAMLGIRLAPSQAELAEREDEKRVSQAWAGPRTVVIVNGKGGSTKTPTTTCLSAVFARYGGGGVLAADENQTRGTLGWRTEQGPHEATILDLLPDTERLLGPNARSSDLAKYVHHQTADKYDVLRSQPQQLRMEQRITPAHIDAIHAVAEKYFRLIFVDTGNDESDPIWLRAVDHADLIVVATTTQEDRAEAGRLLLQTMADGPRQATDLPRDQQERVLHRAQLASRAVVVVSEESPRIPRARVDGLVHGFTDVVGEGHVVSIPHDPAMVSGIIRWEALRKRTRRAWLRAGAAVANLL